MREGEESVVAETVTTETTETVMAELAALEDPKARAVNEKHGDDHGVNLGKLRAIAKRLKTQHELACRLWETGDTAARLLALLICRPKAFGRDELDAMLREARRPKVHDWLVNYVVKKSPHAEELRLAWFADPDPVVARACRQTPVCLATPGTRSRRTGRKPSTSSTQASARHAESTHQTPRGRPSGDDGSLTTGPSAGWSLTTERVAKKPDGLDLAALLDVIEARMKDAPDRLQWAMNHCLAQIGIEHAEYRTRALAIGERLEVLKDYPTPPGCTSPYAPTWITELVRRKDAATSG
ncbi:DNA alkylation repair protein [Streptomyces sp. 5.8]|uniref:DNA alkylation repair protein n=1 Tax=Streptomyces sp. 5.8 TaxID=3406571 RepID=UPI003BB69EA6